MLDKEYYFTPSLLNSWSYAMEVGLEFVFGEVEVNQAMINGTNFENAVDKFVATGVLPDADDDYNACIKNVANRISHCIPQMCLRKEITIKDKNHLLFGFADYVGNDTIYDLKFSKTYDMGKYRNSMQHRMYMYSLGIEKFQYIISDGKDVYTEEYFYPLKDYEILEKEIKSKIVSFMDWLHCRQNVALDFEAKHLKQNKQSILK